jgi:pyruvate carboxylase
LLRA